MRAGNAGTRPRVAASSPVGFITASREASCNKAHVPPDAGTVSGGATRCSVWRGCGVSNHGYDSKHQGPGRRKSGPVHGAVLSREAKCGHANVQRDAGTVSRCDSWGRILPQESGRGVLGENHDSKRFESCMCVARAVAGLVGGVRKFAYEDCSRGGANKNCSSICLTSKRLSLQCDSN